MVILLVLPFLDPKCSMATTSVHLSPGRRPHACRPATECQQMKNWEPFVLGTAFAMDKMAGPVCFRMKFLIIKFLPIDGLAACATVACEVTTLVYQSWNNSVKAETFITKSFLPSAQSTKVFCCLWNFVCKQLEGDAAQGLAISSDVEEHGGADHGGLGDVRGSSGIARPTLFLLNLFPKAVISSNMY